MYFLVGLADEDLVPSPNSQEYDKLPVPPTMLLDDADGLNSSFKQNGDGGSVMLAAERGRTTTLVCAWVYVQPLPAVTSILMVYVPASVYDL